MNAIVVVDRNWAIGCEGNLLFSLPTDMKRFRALTLNGTVIMGRKTLDTFPGGRPLPNRVNVVLSRKEMEIQGAVVCHSPEEAAELTKDAQRVMVIGGGSVYAQMLPMCDRAYVTKVHANPGSDTFFPNLDQDPQWKLEEILQSGEEEGIAYEMCLYVRK